jgi:glycosyltransferase involved in cell wall biosynthesis
MTETGPGGVLVSVLIATKDRLPWLRECLSSARAQSYAPLEIIVSDDGSRDGTVDYVQSVVVLDRRVHLLTDNPAPGVFGNFAHLLKHAKGDAVSLVGDDDLLHPAFIEKLARGLRDPSVGVAYAGFDVIDRDGSARPDKTTLLARHHRLSDTPAGLQPDGAIVALLGQLWLGACLYRTELIRTLGFDTSCGSAADLDLALRAANEASIWYEPERLWSYRDHDTTISRTRLEEGLHAAIVVLGRRSYARPACERLRLNLLRRRLLLAARRGVADHPDEALRLLRAYRANGGSRSAFRYWVIGCVSRLPGPIRRRASRAIDRARAPG